MNRQVQWILALVIATSAIVSASIGITYLGSNQGSPGGGQGIRPTTFQTVVFLSTDTISTFTTETASFSTTLTRTTIFPVSSTQLGTTNQLSETTSSIIDTSTFSLVTSNTSLTSTTLPYANTSSATSSSAPLVSSSTSIAESAANFTTTVTSQILASISCSPSEFQLGLSATCTASVSDPYSAITPTGQISFTSNLAGFFTPPICTLSGSASLASCSTSFSPFGTTTGYYTIGASYSGDALHYGSSSNFTLIVSPPGATMLSCYPSTTDINATTYCVAMVTNSQDFPPPTGTVVFSSTGAGAFVRNGCNLGSSSTCAVTYTPEKGSEGLNTITASYAGDTIHASSMGTFQLTVT